MDEEKILKLKAIIKESNNIVFFGGAGVSTESGIPDFRSAQGIYHDNFRYPPERVVSHSFFYEHNEAFYDFYKIKLVYPNAKPNPCHFALTKLEEEGKLKAIITQNIDGLHQMAGSKNVLELHGSIHRNYCESCHRFYSLDQLMKSATNRCPVCGGLIKPDVVLYEEGLDMELFDRAAQYISRADTFIIGGTSLVVYPAAYLVNYFKGKHLIIINKTPLEVPYENALEICEPIGEVFSHIF